MTHPNALQYQLAAVGQRAELAATTASQGAFSGLTGALPPASETVGGAAAAAAAANTAPSAAAKPEPSVTTVAGLAPAGDHEGAAATSRPSLRLKLALPHQANAAAPGAPAQEAGAAAPKLKLKFGGAKRSASDTGEGSDRSKRAKTSDS